MNAKNIMFEGIRAESEKYHLNGEYVMEIPQRDS